MKDKCSIPAGLASLEGEELGAIIFVRDYLQLNFDGPLLTLLVWPRLRDQAQVLGISDVGYRDKLCQQIGKVVQAIDENSREEVTIQFSDGTELIIPTAEPERCGPEAI